MIKIFEEGRKERKRKGGGTGQRRGVEKDRCSVWVCFWL